MTVFNTIKLLHFPTLKFFIGKGLEPHLFKFSNFNFVHLALSCAKFSCDFEWKDEDLKFPTFSGIDWSL